MSTDMSWVCCPKCGESVWLTRLGQVGVPESRYGSRKHVPDSKKIYCNSCKYTFRTDGAIMLEVMGRDYTDDASF